MTYRSANDRNLRSIANALGVSNVVEGTVRRDGSRVRVTTALVDARTDRTLWSDSYDRNLSDIFAIQSDIAETVASKLSARLPLQEKPTKNLEAYDLYLQAKASIGNASLLLNFGESRVKLLDAVALLEQATRLDPTFALAYCEIAAADGCLIAVRLDATPNRRTHYEAAVNEALRLKPSLPEAHLKAGYYFYDCFRDYVKSHEHLAIAEHLLPNSAEALVLAGYIDRGQGHWEDSTKAFEKACNLDPENPLTLVQLEANYGYIRQYGDQKRIFARLTALEPDNPIVKLEGAMISFNEKADLTPWRRVLETLPSSMKMFSELEFLIVSRDWTKAGELVRSSQSDELPFNGSVVPLVPRACLEIQMSKLQGGRPETNAELGAARGQLLRKITEQPGDPYFLAYLAQIDAYLGRKQEAIQEAKRAVEMLPDAIDGPILRCILAIVYAWTNEPDLAFQELDVSTKTPRGVSYGDLKLDPDWDPLRTDPRFNKLLAQLAPKE